MKVWLYSPRENIPVRLKLEDHSNPAHSVESEVHTTQANQWHELIFDFNNHVLGTEPLIQPGWRFDKASIFFNFGTSGAIAGEEVYYWDNISFGN
ncbi:hypothetical protein [Agarilytica rhodophyticola]|uniref:hypothetical protein n=1 Tax=Agarilytica rhodophyticola TaxID=1737490 RepID=UPI000B344683|nr:hypothetical protein [Agarilytica rhodophyticola]